MDRNDAEQEGITLPPTHAYGHTDAQVRLIARDEANKAIITHLALCPMAIEQISVRLRSLELSFWKMAGFMLGSGTLGGLTGALLSHLLHP